MGRSRFMRVFAPIEEGVLLATPVCDFRNGKAPKTPPLSPHISSLPPLRQELLSKQIKGTLGSAGIHINVLFMQVKKKNGIVNQLSNFATSATISILALFQHSSLRLDVRNARQLVDTLR